MSTDQKEAVRLAAAAVEQIEGPYWSYAHASDWATDERNWLACWAVERLLESNGLKSARDYAHKYAVASERCERIHARYDAVKDLDIKWIGWR